MTNLKAIIFDLKSVVMSCRWWVFGVMCVSFVLSIYLFLCEVSYLPPLQNKMSDYFYKPVFWVSIVSDVIGYFLGAFFTFLIVFSILWLLRKWKKSFYFLYIIVLVIYGVITPILRIKDIEYQKKVAKGKILVDFLKPLIDKRKKVI